MIIPAPQVFFKQVTFEKMSGRRLKMRSFAAVKIQAKYRMVKQLKEYQLIQFCLSHVQALFRAKEARLLLEDRMREAASRVVQKNARAVVQRLKYLKIRRRFIRLQAMVRGKQAKRRSQNLRVYLAASKIQATWRCSVERRVFLEMRKGAAQFQIRWRMRQAKTQLKRLKAEAKEVGALLAKHQKQQEVVKELAKKNQVGTVLGRRRRCWCQE